MNSVFLFDEDGGSGGGGVVNASIDNATQVGSSIWGASSGTLIDGQVTIPGTAMTGMSTAEGYLFWDTGFTAGDNPSISIDMEWAVDSGDSALLFIRAGIVISSSAPASVDFTTDKGRYVSELRGLATFPNANGTFQVIANNADHTSPTGYANHERVRLGGAFIADTALAGACSLMEYDGGSNIISNTGVIDTTGISATDTVYIVLAAGRDTTTGSTVGFNGSLSYSAVAMV